MTEFAQILDVDISAVSRAISRGRLKKSIIMDGDRKKIVVYDGCIEWRDTKNHSKDRGNGVQAACDLPEEIMPVEVSVSIDRHYSALIKKIEFLRETGELISVDKFRTEAFQSARAARDVVLGVPIATNREIFGVILRLLTSPPKPEADDIQKSAETAATECRAIIKKALTKALTGLANYLTDTDEKEAATDS